MKFFQHIYEWIRSFKVKHFRFKETPFVSSLKVLTLLALAYYVLSFVFMYVIFQYPSTSEFSLDGRVAALKMDMGDHDRTLRVTYSKNRPPSKEIIDDVARSVGEYDNTVILPDGTIIDAGWLSNDRESYKFYKVGQNMQAFEKIPVCDDAYVSRWYFDPAYGTGLSPKCTLPKGFNAISYYQAQKEGLSTSNDISTVRVQGGGLPIFGLSNSAWMLSFLFIIGYSHNGLVVDHPDGTSHTVYSYDELVIGKPIREMRVVGYSLDRSLAIIELLKYDSASEHWLSRYYAYDIAHDKWALLTDNPNERVLALR